MNRAISGPFLSVALAGGLTLALSGGAAAEPRETGPAPVEGAYIGIFAGAVVLDQTVHLSSNGNRPAAKLVDQGGDGAIFGLRGGWGTRLSQHVYGGVELEGMMPAEANSRYDVSGQRYRRRLQNEQGVYGRIGWSPDGSSMLFLRGGLALPLSGHDQTLVAVVGAGAEVPIGRRLAGRVDITYSFPYGRDHLETYRLTAGLALRF